MRSINFATVALILVASTSGAASFTTLGDLPGGVNFSRAFAISADGSVVVGDSTVGGPGYSHAFRWTATGGMADLGSLPYPGLPADLVTSYAYGVSGDGSVVVGESNGSPSAGAFRWTAEGGMLPLITPTQAHSQANAISYDGSVIVGENDQTGQAFLWTSAGGLVSLGDLPGGRVLSRAYGISGDGSVVVGASAVSDEYGEAFRWTAADGMVGLGGTQSIALAASADGSVIVGVSNNSDDAREAFRWTAADGLVGLGFLTGGIFESRASAVSADGSVIVGTGRTAPGGNPRDEAFIWTAGNGMQRLLDVLVNQGVTGLDGWILEDARGVSADGTTIVGLAEDPEGVRQAYLAQVTVVPLPAVGWLVGLAFAVLPWARRRGLRSYRSTISK